MVVALARFAFGQEVVIRPSLADPNGTLPEFLILAEGDADSLPQTIVLRAILVAETGEADITDAVDWQSQDTSVATIDQQTATATLGAAGTTVITATLAGLQAAMELTIRENVEPDAILTPVPLLLDPSEAIPRQVLHDGAESFVQGLADGDVPAQRLGEAVTKTSIADDRHAFVHDSGGLGSVTNEKTGALFVAKGTLFDLNIGGFPPRRVDGRLLWTTVDVIVLRPDVAEAMAAGEMFSSSGLTQAAQTFLEELIHAAVHQAGLDDDIGLEAEEAIAKVITGQVVPAMLRISWILDKPFQEWTQQDVTNLSTNVNFNIRQQFQNLRQTWGDEKVDKFLQALGWEDTDHNGLPDWLEDLLRDHGLDPDNLPETPADLPADPEEDPASGGGGPGQVEPVDPHAPLQR